MEKQKVDMMQVWEHLKFGISENLIMKTFNLSRIQLYIITEDLKDAGLLLEGQRCPNCGFIHEEPFEECKKCGIVFWKIEPKMPTLRPRQPQQKSLKTMFRELRSTLGEITHYFIARKKS